MESSRARAESPTGDALWAANAGVVILWPFLPGLFDATGLVAGKRFVSGAARDRAVLLTAHLADAGDEWSEHELLLHRILCGVPLDAPIATRIGLRDGERREADGLLDAAVGHWTTLKSTSRDGLRQAFLRRDGTLTAQESGWKLAVARLGHDILLDTLPWGFGVVMLPWMLQPLHVEW